MKKIIPLLCLGLLSACVNKGYETTEVTDKFSDPNAPKVISMTGNNIDYSAPFMEFSELNAFASIDRDSNKIVNVGVNVKVKSNDMYTSTKWMNIRKGDEIVFLADGERIASTAISSSIDHATQTNTVTGVYTDYYDFATYLLQAEDLRKIAYATSLEFKINGRARSVTFPRENFSLLDSFLKNIREFYDKEVASRL